MKDSFYDSEVLTLVINNVRNRSQNKKSEISIVGSYSLEYVNNNRYIKMTKPVVVIATAEGCPHCTVMRGNGKLLQTDTKRPTIPGGYEWNEKLFYLLASKARVYELHFSSMSMPSSSKVKEFNIFELVDGNVKRTSVTSSIRGTVMVNGMKNTEYAKLSDYIDKIVPSALYSYTVAFPMWMFITGSEWDKHLSTPFSMRLSVMGADVVTESTPTGPKYVLYGMRPLTDGESPVKCLDALIRNPESALPPVARIPVDVAPAPLKRDTVKPLEVGTSAKKNTTPVYRIIPAYF